MPATPVEAGAQRHHRLVRQGSDAAGQRPGDDARPDQEPADRRRRGAREIRRRPGQGHRRPGAVRRQRRQCAGRAGHRRQDRGRADQHLWRSRNPARARRRDQAAEAAPDADRNRRTRRGCRKSWSSSTTTRRCPARSSDSRCSRSTRTSCCRICSEMEFRALGDADDAAARRRSRRLLPAERRGEPVIPEVAPFTAPSAATRWSTRSRARPLDRGGTGGRRGRGLAMPRAHAPGRGPTWPGSRWRWRRACACLCPARPSRCGQAARRSPTPQAIPLDDRARRA